MGYLSDEDTSNMPQLKRPKITRELISRTPIDKSIERLLPSNSDIRNECEDELQQAKALILKLENSYKNAETRNEALHLEYKAKFLEYDEIINQLTSEKKEAEARAIYQHKQAEDAMKALDLIKRDHSSITEGLRLRKDELESQNLRLSSDLISAQSSRERAALELQSKQSEWTSRIYHLEDSVKVLENQVELQQTRIAEGLERESDLTRKWMESDTQLKELNNAKFDTEAIIAFDRQIKLQDDTRKCEIENYKLKAELKHYKELYHNIEILRQEKYSLESRVREMDKVKADNLRLDTENTRLKLEKSEWADYLEKADGLDFETPQGLVHNLTKERYESRLASEQVTALRTELENRDKLLSTLETHIDELKKLNQEKDRIHRSDIFAMELLEKDKSLLKKHVEMLENQYKLYDVEEENYAEGNYDRQKTQRIQELEALLRELEDRLTTQAQDIINSQMKASYPSTTSGPEPYFELTSGQSILDFMFRLLKDRQALTENEKALRCEINSQTNTVNITKHQLQLLQELIDRHGMQPSTSEPPASSEKQSNGTRLLALRNNPASMEYGIRTQQLEALRKENSMLLGLLLQYRNSTGGNGHMDLDGGDKEEYITVPKCTLDNIDQRWKDKVAIQEKRYDRLKTECERIMGKMESIFGYRIKPQLPNTIYLKSIFADDNSLWFCITSLKDDQTLVKFCTRKNGEYGPYYGYLGDLKHLYNRYIVEETCIPGFISAATVELHERQNAHMDDAAGTGDNDNAHNYLEQNPVTDYQGHELVQPELIDQEDELDSDYVAEADDSGDNDYVECIPGNVEGYDEDRLQYFDGQDEEDTEDYSPRIENKEIWHQEITGESTYEGYDNTVDSQDDSGDNKDVKDGDGINDEISYGEDDRMDHNSYNSGNTDQQYDYEEGEDDSEESGEESEMEDYDDDMDSPSGQYSLTQESQQPQQGQQGDPISLDDDDD